MRIDGGRVRRAIDPARHGHERLWVTPHAVLADVQTFHLLAGGDAQADGFLDDPEEPVAEHKHSHEGSRDRDRLGSELVKAAGVEEATLADAVELGQRRGREQTAAERAPDSCESVRRQSAHRVVEKPVEGEYAHHDDYSGDRTDDNPGPRLDIA